MSLTLATVLVASTVTLPSCSWDDPGHSPFMGDVVAAVDRYRDIPPAVRAKLKARMQARAYDDVAVITRDQIKGKRGYSNLREMHFGSGRVCQQIVRSKWKPEHQERGLVYCEGEHCIIVPTVCRNVSRVTPVEPLEFETAAGPREEAPLEFETAAGPRNDLLAGQSFVQGADPLQAAGPLGLTPPAAVVPEPSIAPLNFDTAAGPTDPGIAPPTGPLNPFSPVTPPAPIPEPSSWALMVLGMALLGSRARRLRRG